MIDILTFLLQTYSHHAHYPNEQHLARELGKAGFADEQIQQTLTWQKQLQRVKDQQDANCSPTSDSIRIFSMHEQCVLDASCINFMIKMEQTGSLTTCTRELILDYIAILQPEMLSLAQFKILGLFVLWQTNQEADTLIMSDLLQELELQQYNPDQHAAAYYTYH